MGVPLLIDFYVSDFGIKVIKKGKRYGICLPFFSIVFKNIRTPGKYLFSCQSRYLSAMIIPWKR